MKNKKIKTLIIIAILILIIIGAILGGKKLMLKIIYKKDYQEYVTKYSAEYNVNEDLVYAIIKAESNFDENAVSASNAKGLMQLMYATAEEVAEQCGIELTEENIFDPEINIKIGCWYLNKLYKEFGRLDLVIAAYNGGSGNVNKWLNDDSYSKDGKSLDLIPFEETSMYVKKITKNYKMYNKLYSKEG